MTDSREVGGGTQAERAARTALVVATNNRGKVAEFRELLADLPVEVLAIGEVLPEAPAVVEDGATFLANATKKARAIADAVGMLTLADDSGLEVDALGGRPGVRSARFAGDRATDAENNAALLTALGNVPEPERTARFRCALVLVDPFNHHTPVPVATEGSCEGKIAREPRGTAGFGYDPLFVVQGTGRTMAELSDREKNAISHRAAAVRQLRPQLLAVLHAYEEAASRITLVGGEDP